MRARARERRRPGRARNPPAVRGQRSPRLLMRAHRRQRSKLRQGSQGDKTMKASHLMFGLAAVAGLSFVDASANAQQAGRVITIGEVTIVGRVQKPIASVDVSKIQPKLTLAELRQPFLDRIEQATLKEPF